MPLFVFVQLMQFFSIISLMTGSTFQFQHNLHQILSMWCGFYPFGIWHLPKEVYTTIFNSTAPWTPCVPCSILLWASFGVVPLSLKLPENGCHAVSSIESLAQWEICHELLYNERVFIDTHAIFIYWHIYKYTYHAFLFYYVNRVCTTDLIIQEDVIN